jgi:hypothetical protein
MAIPISNGITGEVALRNFDQGVVDTLGASSGATPPGESQTQACNQLTVPAYPGGSTAVNVYFAQPDSIFRLKTYPFITINRDDITPALHRWMNVAQLEFRAGVSGTQTTVMGKSGFTNYLVKPQAQPYDFTYTISVFDKLETGAQAILAKMLRAFPPVGKLSVFDSLGLNRTYEAYQEGSVANLQDLVDTVTRVRGYAITVRVEGELDLVDPYTTNAVSGFVQDVHRLR